jgi:hypothetical protein
MSQAALCFALDRFSPREPHHPNLLRALTEVQQSWFIRVLQTPTYELNAQTLALTTADTAAFQTFAHRGYIPNYPVSTTFGSTRSPTDFFSHSHASHMAPDDSTISSDSTSTTRQSKNSAPGPPSFFNHGEETPVQTFLDPGGHRSILIGSSPLSPSQRSVVIIPAPSSTTLAHHDENGIPTGFVRRIHCIESSDATVYNYSFGEYYSSTFDQYIIRPFTPPFSH